MLRDIFLIFTVIGCGTLVPLTLVGGHSLYKQWSSVATLMKFTPQYIFGQKFWGYVAIAYIFQLVLFFFIWKNYQAVLVLRRRYFESRDYRLSLHARTLLIRHIPSAYQSDEGLHRIIHDIKSSYDVPKVVVARNTGMLPDLIEKHDQAVRQLEKYLAKYFSDPSRCPSTRPQCKVAEEDQGMYGQLRADAIEYLQYRIRRLRLEIDEMRQRIDSNDTLSFGFASYTHIEDAHAVAYATRKKAPHQSIISLAPKPHDLIWQNLDMSRATRRTRQFWDSLWMILLTIAYVPVNVLSAVFLSDFSHLGLLWPAFMRNLEAHPVSWGIAQGIVAPTFQYLIFLGLPSLFRRLYNHAGDTSKTSRERHVMSRLYAFFVFNNLIVFSVFGSAFRFLASVIEAQDQSVWDAIKHAHVFTNLMAGLCNVSTFWLTYQMQQNLGAAVDIAQLMPLLLGWFKRKFTHPTPRELIESTAPPPLDYASYYNSYLYVATVGMAIGILQPIIFPITAFYLFIELFFKRYMLQYIVITKIESGGSFWRTVINRLLAANVFCNAVVALIVGAQGVGSHDLIQDEAANASMLYALIPLPFLIWAFKWVCSRTFDDKLRYFSTVAKSDMEDVDHMLRKYRKNDRVAVRFGHPALYKKLLTPMVDAKAENMLNQVLSPDFQDKSIAGGATAYSRLGYSDVFIGNAEDGQKPETGGNAEMEQPFELVQEEDMDFEKFKRRAEFRDEFGGDGELYGNPEDLISRSGTPSTLRTLTPDLPKEFRRKPVEPSQLQGVSLPKDEMQDVAISEGHEDSVFQPTSALHEDNGRASSIDIDFPRPELDSQEIFTTALAHGQTK
ncbi:hypothetical protein, variant [Verruconis gallopava]|nr:hypothetical protein, variant [Verruconis gallopava]KIW04562.1 hypothetical protein, variant [Verruconis gallopava]